MTSRSESARSAGFTLIEMLVVIAVMAAILLLITQYGRPHSAALDVRAAGDEVAQAMRAARASAIAEGRAIRFTLPPLPAQVSAQVQAPPGGIVFAADGSATGGQVSLSEGGQHLTLRADWLTGAVVRDAP